MEKDEQNQRFIDAIYFHKTLDKIWGQESPNSSWPPYLLEYYYNKLEVNKNEKIN